MQRLLCSVPVVAVALLSACGGTRHARSHAATPHAAPPASAHHGSDAHHGASTAAPSRHAPVERPGLGTVWGEERVSHVGTRPFDRAGSVPFASVALHYNDEEGAAAHADYRGGYSFAPHRARTPHGGISVALVDEHGRVLPGGDAGGRTLVIGREGARYSVLVENTTGGRYEVVASVDGLDVIDGRAADTRKRGYILEPYGSVLIDGFRRSDSRVAAFRFGRVADSYAARTGGDRNVGVVGVALFAERGSPWTSDELRRRDHANPFPGDRAYARPPL